MNILIPSSIILAASLLSGCPDSNLPKPPPKAPEPKASSVDLPADLLASLSRPAASPA